MPLYYKDASTTKLFQKLKFFFLATLILSNPMSENTDFGMVGVKKL